MIENRLPWFMCFQAKLLEALSGMKPDVKLVYLIMILRIYDVGGPCPDPLETICVRVGLNKRRVSDALDFLFRTGKLVRQSDGIMNPFAEEIIADSIAYREGRKRAGAKGASRRWQKDEQIQQNDDSSAMLLPLATDGHLHLHLQEVKEDIARAKRRSPRSTMPDDWTPTDAGLDYARERRFSAEQISAMIRACRDYHIKRGILIAGERGLAATWRNWCDNEVKFSANRKGQQNGGSSVVDAGRRLLANLGEQGGFNRSSQAKERIGGARSSASHVDVRLLPER